MNKSAVFAMLPPFYDHPLYGNVKIYLKKIEEEFSISVKKYSYLRSAFDHDVFVINNELVFRFPRTEVVRKRLQTEIDFLNFFKDKTSVNIPHYVYISKQGDFAGYRKIPGKILTPSAFKTESKQNKEKIIHQLVIFINQFHSIDLAQFETFHPKKRKDFIEIEERIEQQLKEKLFRKLSKHEISTIKNFYEESKQYLNQIPTCPIHGDLYAYNVVWDKQTCQVGIIDFSDILLGDAASDFEVFYDYGVEYVQKAYEQYRGQKDENFLKRAEIYYKVHAIYTLLSSLLGARIEFDYVHKRFRQKFNL